MNDEYNCEDCKHAITSYNGIMRHIKRYPDGRKLYSNTCIEPNCRCIMAKIPKQEILIKNKVIEEEKQRWKKVIANAIS